MSAGGALETLCRLCARLSDTDAAAAFDPAGIDWEELRELADRHRLSGYLFVRLQGNSLHRSVPPAVLSHWKHYYLRQWTKNELLMAETARIDSALEESGVEALHLKGPLLGLRVHGRLDARAISDIDLLLGRASDLPQAEACLMTLGYRRGSRLPLGPGLTRRFTYHFEYWKGAIPVELHWGLEPNLLPRLDPGRIWRAAEPMVVEGRSYRVPSREDTILAYTVSVPVDIGLGKLAARTLFEIYLLLRQMPAEFDRTAWIERRADEGTRRVTAAVVSCACTLFDHRGDLDSLSSMLDQFTDAGDRSAVLTALAAPATLSPWRRRMSAFRLAGRPIGPGFAWWALTLPARILAHPAGSRRHLP